MEFITRESNDPHLFLSLSGRSVGPTDDGARCVCVFSLLREGKEKERQCQTRGMVINRRGGKRNLEKDKTRQENREQRIGTLERSISRCDAMTRVKAKHAATPHSTLFLLLLRFDKTQIILKS